MKIEEAKESIINNAYGGIKETVFFENVLKIIDQIEPDQPKPVVPQFVADWYEEHKEHLDWGIFDVIWTIKESYAETEFECWLDRNEYSIQTLINMHQFGYTVEKEKLYTVEIPNPNTIAITALKKSNVGDVVMCYQIDNYWKNNSRYQLTEAEIRKDFDWAFRWAEEVTE